MATINLGKVVPEKGIDYFTDADIRSLDIPKNTSDLTNDSGYITDYTETDPTVPSHVKSISQNDISKWDSKADASAIPTKTSQLTNDSKFVTESYVKSEIANAQLSGGDGEVDLSGYATKDEIPTKTSQLTNDSNFITSIPSEYITETELNTKGYLTSIPSAYKTKTENDALYQSKGDYLTSVPSEYITETELNNKGYLTEHQDISDLARRDELHSHNNKSVLDNITQTNVNDWNNKSDFSGSYNDLTNKPTIPTKVSQLTNDSSYASESYVTNAIANAQLSGDGNEVDLSGYATKDDLINKVDKETGKSLIADSEIERLASVTNYNDTEIKNTLATKANASDIPTKVSQLTNDKNYLTSVPSTYKTKTENDALYQSKGDYLTSVPSEYITETELNNKGYLTEHQDISNLATKAEVNAKASITDMTNYITEHKDELKGDTGAQGPQGEQGPKGDTGATGATGPKGNDGTSVTHSWNGTTLSVTSASGTTSANLKGEKGDTGATGGQGPKGDTGATGPQGEKGNDGVGIKTISQTTTSSADSGSNVITVTKTDGTTSTFTVKNGSKGSTGATGPQGEKGATGSQGPKGDTGADGVSPTITTSKSGKVTTITIKDASGTKKATINDGADGAAEEIPSIVLPVKLYAVVGHEFVLYYHNILGAMKPEDFAVTTAFPSGSTLQNREEPHIGAMFDWGLRIMPQTKHIGNHTLTIKVFSRKTWEVVATKNVTLVVSEEKSFSDKKVMFIGDSLTDARVYPAEIERMTNNGVKSIGTLNKSISFNGGTANVNCEGRSGACSYEYVNDTSIASNYSNPFYNPNTSYTLTLDDKYSGSGVYTSALPVDNSGDKSVITHHFDFAYYMANNGATVGEPDAVFINLGSNCGKISTYKTAYMSFCAMIDRIRAYSSELPIFVHLCPPKSEAGSTDRRASGCVSGWLNKRTWFYDITQFFIDKFDNDPRVMVVPTYAMIDPVYDFKRQTIEVSARNDEKITLGHNDGVHPATPGYLHMADSYFNILQALWSGEVVDTYYSVTNNLTNVTNSNTTSTIKEGNSYSATLTANTGYNLSTVNVTMGGNAVSVSGGVINIPSVSGNIVITATATKEEVPEEPIINNLVDPSTANDSSPNLVITADEWVNGYYITSSSASSTDGVLSADSKYITTDKIPVTDDSVIHITGLDNASTYKGKTKMVVGLSDGRLFRSMALPFIESTDGSGATKLNSDGSLSVTLSKFGQAANWKGKSWARFCCHPKDGNNANIIVTVE